MPHLNFEPKSPIGLDPNLSTTQDNVLSNVKQEVSDVKQETKIAQASDNPIPQFKDNPIAAISLALKEIGAAMQGIESPIARLRQQHVQNQGMKLQQTKLGLSALEQGIKLLEGVSDPAQQDKIINNYAPQFESALPGFTEMLRSSANRTDVDMKAMLRLAGPNADILSKLAHGDPEMMEKLLTDPKWKPLFENAVDDENLPLLGPKLAMIRNVADKLPANIQALLAKDTEGNLIIGVNDLQMINESMPEILEEMKITDDDLDTLGRHPSMATLHGIAMPEIIEARAKEGLKARKPITHIVNNPETGQKELVLSDPFSGQEISRRGLAELDKKLDTSEFNVVMKLIAAGNDVQAMEGISEETKIAVADQDQESAQKFIETGNVISEIVTVDKDGNVSIIKGKAADIELRQKAKRIDDLIPKEIAVRKVSSGIENLIKISEDDPGVATFSRGLFRLGASATANVDEIVRNFDLDTSNLTIKDPITEKDFENINFRETFERLFPEIAGRDAAFQAGAFNVAYMVAAARGTVGKALSDKELALTINNLGASLDDQKARIAALRETRQSLIKGFKIETKVIKNEEFTDLDHFLKVDSTGNEFDALKLNELEAIERLDVETLNATYSPDQIKQIQKALRKKRGKK